MARTRDEKDNAKPFCPWRPLGTPLLLNCCWCVHPMRAGAAGSLMIRLRVSPAGRLERDRDGVDGLSCLIDRSRTKCTAERHEVRQSAAGCPRAGGDSSHATGRTSYPHSPFSLLFSPLSLFVSLTRILFEQAVIRFSKSPLDFPMRLRSPEGPFTGLFSPRLPVLTREGFHAPRARKSAFKTKLIDFVPFFTL